MRFCCPLFIGSTIPSDSLPAARHFTFRAYRFAPYEKKKHLVRGRVSLVPSTTFPTCRSPYAGEFFCAALPRASRIPWSSPKHTRLDSLLSFSGLFCRRGRIHLMLRPAVLLAPLAGLLCHRASTLGSLHQLPVSYEATWLLPRLNFHQLVVPSLARRAMSKKVHILCG
jgi:hypothetical protein